MQRKLPFTLALLALSACQLNPVECDSECMASWMDGPGYDDPIHSGDSTFKLSTRIPVPDSITLQKRVVLAVHGYTASTYEWLEFRRFAEADTNVLVSLVLMGAHGADIDDFKDTRWEDWAKPILEEYTTLARMGYDNLSLLGSSAGCPIILQYVRRRAFDTLPYPRQILFIDPLVVPTAKILSAANLVGPIIGNSPNPGDTPEEKQNWYQNRPAETLAELYELINLVKNDLEDGFTLPIGTRCKVWKSLQDASVDPVSALLIYKGLRHADGSRIEAEMVDSKLHVFTRLAGRPRATAADTALQMRVFTEILNRL
jgi:carboxylesterase